MDSLMIDSLIALTDTPRRVFFAPDISQDKKPECWVLPPYLLSFSANKHLAVRWGLAVWSRNQSQCPWHAGTWRSPNYPRSMPQATSSLAMIDATLLSPKFGSGPCPPLASSRTMDATIRLPRSTYVLFFSTLMHSATVYFIAAGVHSVDQVDFFPPQTPPGVIIALELLFHLKLIS